MSRGRSARGGDIGMPQEMPQEMVQSSDGGGGRGGRTRGGDIGQRSAARAAEIGGETDPMGDGKGGVEAFQRLEDMLDRKKGVLAEDFFLACAARPPARAAACQPAATSPRRAHCSAPIGVLTRTLGVAGTTCTSSSGPTSLATKPSRPSSSRTWCGSCARSRKTSRAARRGTCT